MDVELSEHTRQRIERLVESGRFASAEEVVDSALQFVEAEDGEFWQRMTGAHETLETFADRLGGDRKARLLSSLVEASDDIAAGRTVPAEEAIRRARDLVQKKHARGVTPR